MPPRIVFFGSPDFALPSLTALLDAGQQVVAVVTQPDRPAGRGHASTSPPVKLLALERGLPVLQPENVSDAESVAQLQALQPDIFVIAAYGQILRQRVLDLPSRGTLNVHASLLPRHRGASPVTAAILAGDDVAGVTIMEMVRKLDAGPMVSKVEVAISPFDTTGTLERHLADAGAVLLKDTLPAWYERRIEPEPQDESLVSYAPQLRREDARLDWSLSAVELERRVRAYMPWPIAFTTWVGQDLRILEAWPLDGESGTAPGTVLPPEPVPREADAAGEVTFSVQTGLGRLAVRRVQRQGRGAMTGGDFLRGQRDLIGSVLGQ